VFKFTSGDILGSEAEALVNTVNCVGVMGRGIVLQFKKAFPGNFTAYEEACKLGEVKPGTRFVTETGLLTGPKCDRTEAHHQLPDEEALERKEFDGGY
jgi:O-acetyl-ADP-ribose deacetylase (regulator of RNase III)